MPKSTFTIYRLIDGKKAPNKPFKNPNSYDTARYKYSYAYCKGRFESTLTTDPPTHNHEEKEYYGLLLVLDTDATAPAPANRPDIDLTVFQEAPLPANSMCL